MANITPPNNNVRRLDLAKMEEDLQNMAREPSYAPKAPMPGVRKTADAVLEQYEVAVKAMEALREIVQKDMHDMDASLSERDEDFRMITEAAQAIRDKSNQIRAQIDRASAVSASIRDAVAKCMASIA